MTLVPMMAAAMTRAWTSQAAFLKRFVRAGGRVAAGTGFELRGYPVPGVGLHQELAALVRAGLTPAEALRAATVTVAELVGAKAGFAPGTEANFIVVSGDPLKRIEDLGNITNVVRAGEVLDVKALLARAKQAAAPRGLPSAALPSTTLGAGRAEKPPGSISQKRPGLQTGHDPEHR